MHARAFHILVNHRLSKALKLGSQSALSRRESPDTFRGVNSHFSESDVNPIVNNQRKSGH
jgi:nitrate reductase cytochrome c-type subunit